MNIRNPRGLSARVLIFREETAGRKSKGKCAGSVPDFSAGKMLFDVDIIGTLL